MYSIWAEAHGAFGLCVQAMLQRCATVFGSAITPCINPPLHKPAQHAKRVEPLALLEGKPLSSLFSTLFLKSAPKARCLKDFELNHTCFREQRNSVDKETQELYHALMLQPLLCQPA